MGIFLLSRLGVATALTFDGFIPFEAGDFVAYIGKFCFDYRPEFEPVKASSDAGDLTLEVQNDVEGTLTPMGKGELYMLLFDDEQGHWKQAREGWQSTSCADKLGAASASVKIEFKDNSREFTHLFHIREHRRPRFWYFAFIGCGFEDRGLERRISYQIHAMNPTLGWQQEFSLDHSGLVYVFVAGLVGFTLSALGITWFGILSPHAQDPPLKDHPYISLLMGANYGGCASCLAHLAHYWLLVHNGFGSLRLRFLGIFFGISVTCCMYLVALLASCGWAITTKALPNRRTFLTLVTLVGGTQGLCELIAEHAVSKSTKLYAYSSGTGVILLTLKCFVFSWLGFQVKNSYEAEVDERRKRFYLRLGIICAIWALTVPGSVLLASTIAPWYRHKVVTTHDLFSKLVALMLLTRLFTGPLTPLSRENILTLRHVRDLPIARRLEGWGQLPSGEDAAAARPGSASSPPMSLGIQAGDSPSR